MCDASGKTKFRKNVYCQRWELYSKELCFRSFLRPVGMAKLREVSRLHVIWTLNSGHLLTAAPHPPPTHKKPPSSSQPWPEQCQWPRRRTWAVWPGLQTQVCRLQSCYQAQTDMKGSVEQFLLKFGSTERQIIFERSCEEFAKMPSGP